MTSIEFRESMHDLFYDSNRAYDSIEKIYETFIYYSDKSKNNYEQI